MEASDILFEKDGVCIEVDSIDVSANKDVIGGRVQILHRDRQGLVVEWIPYVGVEASSQLKFIKNNGSKSEQVRFSQAVTTTLEGPTLEEESEIWKNQRQITFELKELNSIKRSVGPVAGGARTNIIFLLKDGTTLPAFHFYQGGSSEFIGELEKHIILKPSHNDPKLYLVMDYDAGLLSRSFEGLQLGDSPAPFVSRFLQDPYRSTLTGFSKVTRFLHHALVEPGQDDNFAERNSEVKFSELDDVPPGLLVQHEDDMPGYEIICRTELPPRPSVTRQEPLSPALWQNYLDSEGRIVDKDGLKEIIFKGGVEHSLRSDIWKFLLRYQSWGSTTQERYDQRKKKIDEYFKMKLQWKSMTPQQEQRFSLYRERKSLIDKDVSRTDRNHKYFHGENNANLVVMRDILLTYVMYNFDLGYVQGMSDLLAPIMVVMENEVDSFWCFVGFMDMVHHNFEYSQQGMKQQLNHLHKLLRFSDAELYNYLDCHESGNLYFCFRWLLVLFKREFNYQKIMRLWEVLWTGLPCKNFHLFFCLAILDTERIILMQNNFGLSEILKHMNDLSLNIDLEENLRKADAIYKQLLQCRELPSDIRYIIGLETNGSPPTNRTAVKTCSDCANVEHQSSLDSGAFRTVHSPEIRTTPKQYCSHIGSASSNTPSGEEQPHSKERERTCSSDIEILS